MEAAGTWALLLVLLLLLLSLALPARRARAPLPPGPAPLPLLGNLLQLRPGALYAGLLRVSGPVAGVPWEGARGGRRGRGPGQRDRRALGRGQEQPVRAEKARDALEKGPGLGTRARRGRARSILERWREQEAGLRGSGSQPRGL